jgi:hypothetical protein
MARHHLPDARPKFVKQVPARIIPNRGTEIAEWRRTGVRPIASRGAVGSDRGQYPKKIRSVQLALPHFIPHYKNSRSGIRRSLHHLFAGRWLISRTPIQHRRIQIFPQKNFSPRFARDRVVEHGCAWGFRKDDSRPGFAQYARIDCRRANGWEHARLIRQALKLGCRVQNPCRGGIGQGPDNSPLALLACALRRLAMMHVNLRTPTLT